MKYFKVKDWSELDRVLGEVQAVIDRCPPLRDNHNYAWCIHDKLTAHCLRRDAVQFVKALATFNQINFKTAGINYAGIVKFAIAHAFYCFNLSLVDEGFQLISKANSTHIDTHQLTKVKSLTFK